MKKKNYEVLRNHYGLLQVFKWCVINSKSSIPFLLLHPLFPFSSPFPFLPLSLTLPHPLSPFCLASPLSHLPIAVSLLCSLQSLVFHFPSSVSHLPFAVSLLSSLVFRLPFPDFCFLSLISCLPSTYLFSLVIPCKKSMWTEKKSD